MKCLLHGIVFRILSSTAVYSKNSQEQVLNTMPLTNITKVLLHFYHIWILCHIYIWYFKILHVEILNHLYFKLEKLKRDPLLFCSDRHVGKIYSKCSSFLDYVRMSLKKLGLDEYKVSVWLPFSFTRILGRAVNWNNTKSFAFY